MHRLPRRSVRRRRGPARAQRIQAFALGLSGASNPDRALGPEVSAADLVGLGVARAETELAEELDVQAGLENPHWPWRIDVMLAEIDRRQGRHNEAEARLKEAEGKLGDDPL